MKLPYVCKRKVSLTLKDFNSDISRMQQVFANCRGRRSFKAEDQVTTASLKVLCNLYGQRLLTANLVGNDGKCAKNVRLRHGYISLLREPKFVCETKRQIDSKKEMQRGPNDPAMIHCKRSVRSIDLFCEQVFAE